MKDKTRGQIELSLYCKSSVQTFLLWEKFTITMSDTFKFHVSVWISESSRMPFKTLLRVPLQALSAYKRIVCDAETPPPPPPLDEEGVNFEAPSWMKSKKASRWSELLKTDSVKKLRRKRSSAEEEDEAEIDDIEDKPITDAAINHQPELQGPPGLEVDLSKEGQLANMEVKEEDCCWLDRLTAAGGSEGNSKVFTFPVAVKADTALPGSSEAVNGTMADPPGLEVSSLSESNFETPQRKPAAANHSPSPLESGEIRQVKRPKISAGIQEDALSRDQQAVLHGLANGSLPRLQDK